MLWPDEALLGSFDHGLCCGDLSLANGPIGLDLNDDAELYVEECPPGPLRGVIGP
jgi:hypothetical protein